MKHNCLIEFLSSLCFALMVLTDNVAYAQSIELKTGSYARDMDMINLITQPGNWSKDLFRKMDQAISTDASFGNMTEKQMKDAYKHLLESSSKYSLDEMRRIMQKKLVKKEDFEKYREMNKFLLAEYNEKCTSLSIPQDTFVLHMSNDLIVEYDRVYRYAFNIFYKQAKLKDGVGQPYRAISCEEAKSKIKSNKYWEGYFKNNQLFVDAILKLPQMRAEAIDSYYDKLYDLYVQVFSKEPILVDDKTFYLVSSRQMQDATDFCNWAQNDDAIKAARKMAQFQKTMKVKE